MPSPLRPLASPCRGGLVLLLVSAMLLLSSAAHSAEGSTRVLSVGKELVAETMPLRHGRRVYRIDGLRPSAWYEVKISYPASIPSSFSIRLVDDPDNADWSSKNRRLLNTEKIIFKAEGSNPVYVLVTVEPEGVVARPNVPERELALFNIVCDELMLGIPLFAWWVGIAALLCIVLASLAPLVLPLHKLLNYEGSDLSKADAAKMSGYLQQWRPKNETYFTFGSCTVNRLRPKISASPTANAKSGALLPFPFSPLPPLPPLPPSSSCVRRGREGTGLPGAAAPADKSAARRRSCPTRWPPPPPCVRRRRWPWRARLRRPWELDPSTATRELSPAMGELDPGRHGGSQSRPAAASRSAATTAMASSAPAAWSSSWSSSVEAAWRSSTLARTWGARPRCQGELNPSGLGEPTSPQLRASLSSAAAAAPASPPLPAAPERIRRPRRAPSVPARIRRPRRAPAAPERSRRPRAAAAAPAAPTRIWRQIRCAGPLLLPLLRAPEEWVAVRGDACLRRASQATQNAFHVWVGCWRVIWIPKRTVPNLF